MKLRAAGSAKAPDIHPMDAFAEPALAKFDSKSDDLLVNVTAAAEATALPSTSTKSIKLLKS